MRVPRAKLGGAPRFAGGIGVVEACYRISRAASSRIGSRSSDVNLEQPLTGAAPSGMGPTEAAPVARARRNRSKKAKGPVQRRVLTIINATGSALTAFEVGADGQSARLPRELGDNESATLRLPAFRSCKVALMATFGRIGHSETYEQDICKDPNVRLVN